jgi:putative ABC transport system permease protein
MAVRIMASVKTIIIQFLTEAIILTAIGGFFGMIIGILISYIISSLISMPFVLSLSSMFLAVGVSGVIGIIFGWYPARMASNLQPIEALRYE